ncbi:MAG TPA: hypothetical protein VMD91_13680 [Candidatus Sulfotelmatobacter sp.]|nr:hypothetical protein [Candidatus Sulfotelmatobacter sp.]
MRSLLVLALLVPASPAGAQDAAHVNPVASSGLVTFSVPRSLAAFTVQRQVTPDEGPPRPQWGSPGYPVPPAFYPLAVPNQARGPLRFEPHIVPGPGLVPQTVRPPQQ